ncbi:ketosteroid isomerase [Chryseobacterium lactis]|uniref:Ketosteroid isomerase n=1 Tax=Chryseobacterium lactis TaxID=1241981 RepID=A0A3G6RJZ7_CHRLC|nr:nuclear transport factor 2 family protein [Chryseobacterium lactis]AZA83145.1 nuclear transport factor 2 family protein [Chryseobacterium lactis]AZB03529.1 nuclear transport factor 2 family protein [Chryseobacterium lactis]PNW11965.1 ketosteroid isomerase [Chryseobacterium lactis]
MNTNSKQILESANSAITKGDYEGFLSFCADHVKWNFIGDQILNGKEEVRQYMAKNYLEPPTFKVEKLVAEDDIVIAVGKISMKNSDGKTVDYSYCDVWRFQDNKMVELEAFVIED